jgi:hypothetical protein
MDLTEEQRKQMPALVRVAATQNQLIRNSTKPNAATASVRGQRWEWHRADLRDVKSSAGDRHKRTARNVIAGGGLGLAVFINGGASRGWNFSHTAVLLVA